MTIENTTLGIISDKTNYQPYPYGNKSGTPTVHVRVSKAKQKQEKIRSIRGKFNGWGWGEKLNSGFARLRFSGNDVLGESHSEGITELSRILDARFVDIEVDSSDLKRPPRDLQNAVDSYTVFVDKDRDFDDDAFEFFVERSQRYGDVEFIFKVDTHTDEAAISNIVRDYRIYDSDVWLFPRGRKVSTVAERMDPAVKIGKRNSWNVSPRLDVIAEYEEDD